MYEEGGGGGGGGGAKKILALAKAIDNLYSPDLFNLNQQTSGQQPPLSEYGINLCQPCVRPLFTTSLQHNRWKFLSNSLAFITKLFDCKIIE